MPCNQHSPLETSAHVGLGYGHRRNRVDRLQGCFDLVLRRVESQVLRKAAAVGKRHGALQRGHSLDDLDDIRSRGRAGQPGGVNLQMQENGRKRKQNVVVPRFRKEAFQQIVLVIGASPINVPLIVHPPPGNTYGI